ncbi:protein DpdH [Agrobacterium vitis]|uniref:protein DpdH n=1 Tax=Agrobacterium vitis TaxID=373 RepID=UPI0012E77CF8|nr:protein DpdH [Agrobacterium vitis]MVA26555.1 hypothetical protein [Agrobacterium vitis]
MLERYWPDAAAVNACIKNEAETADVSVLLAVHQPAPLIQRGAVSGNKTSGSEQDLLEAFLTDNVPTGALLMPITGPSGVGKSHIIRWLDAQLQRSAKRDQLHIIRIPKSASLRTVVELILEPLKGDPRYAKAREDMTRAVSEVNLAEAVVTFRAHLQNALTASRARMVTEVRENPERAHLKALIAHADKLPQLFSDGALEQHFSEKVLSRVVSRALGGRTEDQSDEDALPQFSVADLVLPETVAINQASRPVHDYYVRNIAGVEVEKLGAVVDLLNDAVDPAIGNLFQLQQSTGGITLQDIILAVREILLADNKDLVLLVEDFAALAGIQEVLLKVCIQEGERDGKKVRATMRTALALTDGYLSFRDTILTRAQREWVVGGRTQSDSEIKASVVEMVGAYLNAARWGEAELERRFNLKGDSQELHDWLPSWRDEDISESESEAVAAFGYNEKGDALFPFNRRAIEQLTVRHLTVGGNLLFNPRRIINEILRNTLLMRGTYLAGGFPPAGYEAMAPNAVLANWLRQTHQPEQISRRLAPLLVAWGGDPIDQNEIAHMHPAIFTTFNLPPPLELANIKFTPEPERPTVPKAVVVDTKSGSVKELIEPEVPEPEHPKITDLRSKLDAWSKGALLGQNEARDIRTALFELLKDAIDWPSLRMRSSDLRAAWINIPNAWGNPRSGPYLHVCEDQSDEYGTIRAGLIAAVRFANLNGRRWTYSEADDDYVAVAPIVDHLLGQLMPKLLNEAKAQSASLAKALLTQARIAGLSPSVRPSGPDVILEGMFSFTDLKSEAQPFEENWDSLRASALSMMRQRPAWVALQEELLARSASFQGTGNTPFAIDTVRLLDAFGEEAYGTEALDGLPEDVRVFLRPLAEARLWPQLTPVVQKLDNFKRQIADYVDANFDKSTFVADLQTIVMLLAKTGTAPSNGINLKEFEKQLLEFKQSAFVDLVGKINVITEADREQIPKLLNALGAIDLGLIGRTMMFLNQTTQLLSASEISVSREEANRSQSDPSDVSQEIVAMLESVAGIYSQAEGEVR